MPTLFRMGCDCMDTLLNKTATFVPTCYTDKAGGSVNEFAEPVTGVITMVHKMHRWFLVSYRAGKTIQRECFHFDEIDEAVTVHG